jgi:hypothetical protein
MMATESFSSPAVSQTATGGGATGFDNLIKPQKYAEYPTTGAQEGKPEILGGFGSKGQYQQQQGMGISMGGGGMTQEGRVFEGQPLVEQLFSGVWTSAKWIGNTITNVFGLVSRPVLDSMTYYGYILSDTASLYIREYPILRSLVYGTFNSHSSTCYNEFHY